jgi:hypothetical protein
MSKISSDIDVIVWDRDTLLAWPTSTSFSGLHLKTVASSPRNLPFEEATVFRCKPEEEMHVGHAKIVRLSACD